MQGPGLRSQCLNPSISPPVKLPPPFPDGGIPATCCGDKPISRGRVMREKEQPLGGARADISRALFPSGPGARFGCRVPWSSARHRETASVARGFAHWTPPPRPVSARAQKPNGGGERSQGARERRPNRPFAAPTGAHARPALQGKTLSLARGAGGGDTENASLPPPPHPARKPLITKPPPSGTVA